MEKGMKPYKLILEGKGGEVYGGKVRRKDYEYLKANKIDFEEFVFCEVVDEDDIDGDIWERIIDPRKLDMFPPGMPEVCNDFYSHRGIYLDSLYDGSGITVKLKSPNNRIQWEKTYRAEHSAIHVDHVGEVDFNRQHTGTVIVHGSLYNGIWSHELLLPLKDDEIFDSNKLFLMVVKLGDTNLITGVGYDVDQLHGDARFKQEPSDDTTNWFIVGGEEWYESVSIHDRNLS